MVLDDDAPLVGLLPSFPARSTAPVLGAWMLVRPDRNAKYFDLRSLGAALGIGEAVIVGFLSCLVEEGADQGKLLSSNAIQCRCDVEC